MITSLILLLGLYALLSFSLRAIASKHCETISRAGVPNNNELRQTLTIYRWSRVSCWVSTIVLAALIVTYVVSGGL